MLIDQMTKMGFLVTVYPTQFSGDAKLTIEREGKHFDRIVVCGGDGMMHEAVNGWIKGSDMPLLGYIPSGTVNDFASTHEIPKDIFQAAAIACGDAYTSLDVGQFNDEYFSYVAAFGVGTSVSYQTPQRKKQRLGPAAYILELLNTVDFTHWENNCETMKISWEGGSAEGDFLYGMVSNSKFIAGTEVFTSDLFNWHDGLLEGIFIRRPMNIVELNTIIGCITRLDFNNPLFVQAQSPWFDFESHHSAWTLDGEFGGIHDHVKARAIKSAIKIALPKDHILSEGISQVISNPQITSSFHQGQRTDHQSGSSSDGDEEAGDEDHPARLQPHLAKQPIATEADQPVPLSGDGKSALEKPDLARASNPSAQDQPQPKEIIEAAQTTLNPLEKMAKESMVQTPVDEPLPVFCAPVLEEEPEPADSLQAGMENQKPPITSSAQDRKNHTQPGADKIYDGLSQNLSRPLEQSVHTVHPQDSAFARQAASKSGWNVLEKAELAFELQEAQNALAHSIAPVKRKGQEKTPKPMAKRAIDTRYHGQNAGNKPSNHPRQPKGTTNSDPAGPSSLSRERRNAFVRPERDYPQNIDWNQNRNSSQRKDYRKEYKGGKSRGQ